MIEKGRKKKRAMPATPAHAEGEGANEGHRPVPGLPACEENHQADADLDKNLSSAVPTMPSHDGPRYRPDEGMPSSGGAAAWAAQASRDRGRGYYSADTLNANRDSEGYGQPHGHAARSGGDHGQGRNADLAVGHRGPSVAGALVRMLNQHYENTGPVVRPGAPQASFTGQASGAGSPLGATDRPPGADGGNPRVTMVSFRDQAGGGMVGGLPGVPTGALDTHPPQTTYTSAPLSPSNRPALKQDEPSAFDIMKLTMRRL